MTFVMLIVGTGTKTPVLMWLVAMGCDTTLIMTFMLLKAFGRL